MTLSNIVKLALAFTCLVLYIVGVLFALNVLETKGASLGTVKADSTSQSPSVEIISHEDGTQCEEVDGNKSKCWTVPITPLYLMRFMDGASVKSRVPVGPIELEISEITFTNDQVCLFQRNELLECTPLNTSAELAQL